MIITVEKMLYDFLEKKLDGKGIKVYRGLLPETKHSDREEGKEKNKLFPFALLRLNEFKQTRTNTSGYDVPVDFEIWIGTKLETEEDYLKNLEIGDYLKQEFLNNSLLDGKFSVDQSFPFSVEYFSDEMYPYFYSLCKFRVYGIPTTSDVVNTNIDKLLGRS